MWRKVWDHLQLRGQDVLDVIHYTRLWLHYGTIAFVFLVVAAAGLAGFFAR